MVSSGISCGHCKGRHSSVDGVKACATGASTVSVQPTQSIAEFKRGWKAGYAAAVDFISSGITPNWRADFEVGQLCCDQCSLGGGPMAEYSECDCGCTERCRPESPTEWKIPDAFGK